MTFVVTAITNSKKLQFKFIVFALASPLDDNMSALSCLAILAEVMIKALKRELKSQVIGIGASRRLLQRFLVNNRGNDRKVRLLQNLCQGREKPISRLRVLEDAEVLPWLADFSFMEDDLVMPQKLSLKR